MYIYNFFNNFFKFLCILWYTVLYGTWYKKIKIDSRYDSHYNYDNNNLLSIIYCKNIIDVYIFIFIFFIWEPGPFWLFGNIESCEPETLYSLQCSHFTSLCRIYSKWHIPFLSLTHFICTTVLVVLVSFSKKLKK